MWCGVSGLLGWERPLIIMNSINPQRGAPAPMLMIEEHLLWQIITNNKNISRQ